MSLRPAVEVSRVVAGVGASLLEVLIVHQGCALPGTGGQQ